MVELARHPAGFVESGEGAAAFSGDVVVEKVGADGIAHKHLSDVRYDDPAFAVGPNMSQAFFEWIASTLDRKLTRKDGAISFRTTPALDDGHTLLAYLQEAGVVPRNHDGL